MKTRGIGLVPLAVLGATACGLGPIWEPSPILDAFSTHIRLCGFPATQLVEHPNFGHFGRLRVGQRIPLKLDGETDRIASVRWSVEAVHDQAPHPPDVRFTPTGRYTATLEAVAAGGDAPTDYVFAGAGLTFQDGSEGGVNPGVCGSGGNWVPATRLAVVP